MKKSTLIALGLALAAAAALLVVLRQQRSVAAQSPPDRAFAVADAGEIARVFLADMQGRSLDLRRGPRGGWSIGDSLKVRPSIAASLERALTQLRIDHIPPRTMGPTIFEALATSAIKVQVFGRAGEQLRSFLIGPASTDERTTYMLVEGQSQPYAMSIPGFIGTLRPLFDLRSLADWRDLDFVDVAASGIRSVEVNYPRAPGASFKIYRSGRALRLEPLAELVDASGAVANATALSGYLSAFEGVSLFTREDNGTLGDSIRRQIPEVELRLEPEVGAVLELALYPIHAGDERGAPTPRDAAAAVYYVDVDRGTELVRVQAKQIRPWLRSYESFLR